MIELAGKKVLVTGPQSMLGKEVVSCLKKRNAIIQVAFHEDIDLMIYEDIKNLIEDLRTEYVIHLAGYNGNISFNAKYPADIFFRTSIMGQNVLKACADNKIKKVVSILSSCGYKASALPLEDVSFLDGEPDVSTEAHAYGKRDLLIFSKLLKKQYDLNAVCCITNTIYGPHDNFDLDKTKVVGSLIKKFIEAVENKEQVVECWGTGLPKRELIYCADAAEGVVQTLEKYNDVQLPLNIGFQEDVTIAKLATTIAEITGFVGEIKWLTEKNDGVMRKILNSSRMKAYGIEIDKTTLTRGLEKTISWYKENK